MHRPMVTDEFEDAINECVASKVPKLPQRHAATEMLIFVRIAPRAVQGTFARDLYREHRGLAAENPAPGSKKSKRVHEGRIYATFMPRLVLVG